MDYAEWFAKRLRATLGDMPQTDLIKLMAEDGYEMTAGRLSHYMQGRNFPDPPALAALAHALGVSADYLLGLTEDATPAAELSDQVAASEGASRVDKLLRAMTREQKHQVLTFAEFVLAQSQHNEAGAKAALDANDRLHGPKSTDEMLDLVTANFAELRALLTHEATPKHKRVDIR